MSHDSSLRCTGADNNVRLFLGLPVPVSRLVGWTRMSETIDASRELAAFLRTRRERLAPHDVELPEGRRPRRTPGLRREEVAELAKVSVDYVIRLEQGRGLRPSPEVLEALAGAWRLSIDERAYLFDLAQHRHGSGREPTWPDPRHSRPAGRRAPHTRPTTR